MKLSSSQLEAFYAVAQTLSFSKAGLLLGVTQSAVSQRLNNLEYELGTTLILRDSSNPRLTETGEKLLRYCQTQDQMEMEILSSLKPEKNNELRGILRIGGFSSIMRSMVIPALAPLMNKNQNLSLSLVSKELGELLSLLKRSEVDLILTTQDPNREEMVSEFLGYEENVLVESKKFPNLDTYLDHDAEDMTTNAYLKLLKKAPKSIKKRYLDDSYGLIEGVKRGYGKSVIPRHLIKDESELRVLNPTVSLNVSVYLVHYRQPFYGQIHKHAVEAIVSYFKNNLHQRKTHPKPT